MNVTLNLNRELGHRLRQAAEHRGVSVEAYTAQLPEQHLPDEGRRADPATAGEHAQGARRDVDELAVDHVSVG